MSTLEALAKDMCHDLLSAAQLKAVCRYRGFSPPGGQKDVLAAFLAPRLLETTGASEAMASLVEPWLLVLHRIALDDEPVSLDDLHPIVHTARRPQGIDYRQFFAEVADGLLTRGVVLVEDPPEDGSRRASRFARLRLHLPEVHRGRVPPFPLTTAPLGEGAASRDPLRFCRDAFRAALAPADKPRTPWLVARVASAIAMDGTLHVGKSSAPDLETFLRVVRAEWAKGPGGSTGPRATRTERALGAADHVLAHLPAGEGAATGDMRAALSRLALTVDAGILGEFCEGGFEAGLLVRGGRGSAGIYAARPGRDALPGDGALVFAAGAAGDGGVEIDIDRTGFQPLFELARLSRVECRDGRLCLLPDIVRLGRAWPQSASLAVLRTVRASSPAFDQALDHVERRHGKLLVHEGLLVLRIEDLGFRTFLMHRLGGSIRSLGGAYLAAPRGLAAEVEKLARKEGFAPRRVA
jgi:hypothetical protein